MNFDWCAGYKKFKFIATNWLAWSKRWRLILMRFKTLTLYRTLSWIVVSLNRWRLGHRVNLLQDNSHMNQFANVWKKIVANGITIARATGASGAFDPPDPPAELPEPLSVLDAATGQPTLVLLTLLFWFIRTFAATFSWYWCSVLHTASWLVPACPAAIELTP